jgi:phosphopantothenoylcysteine decarboxylase/phosphopantothenate--cysteine ligase
MNTNMYGHPVTRENIAKLKKAGYGFIGPSSGKLACGAEGIGRLSDPCDIVKAVKRFAK